MFEQNLLDIRKDCQFHKRDRQDLMKSYIEQRLTESLNSYYKTLSSSVYALSVAEPEKVVKEL